jgi:hypothetical protein
MEAREHQPQVAQALLPVLLGFSFPATPTLLHLEI